MNNAYIATGLDHSVQQISPSNQVVCKQHWNRNGFSLIEVVIAIAIVSMAIPTMLGLSALFAKNSKQLYIQHESIEILNALNTFLVDQHTKDSTSPAPSSAGADPTAKTLFVYKSKDKTKSAGISTDLTVSDKNPGQEALTDSFFHAEVITLPPNINAPRDNYIQLTLTLYKHTAGANQKKSNASKIGVFPITILK